MLRSPRRSGPEPRDLRLRLFVFDLRVDFRRGVAGRRLIGWRRRLRCRDDLRPWSGRPRAAPMWRRDVCDASPSLLLSGAEPTDVQERRRLHDRKRRFVRVRRAQRLRRERRVLLQRRGRAEPPAIPRSKPVRSTPSATTRARAASRRRVTPNASTSAGSRETVTSDAATRLLRLFNVEERVLQR